MVNETVAPDADTETPMPIMRGFLLVLPSTDSPVEHADRLLSEFGADHCSALAREILTHIQRQRMRRGVIQE